MNTRLHVQSWWETARQHQFDPNFQLAPSGTMRLRRSTHSTSTCVSSTRHWKSRKSHARPVKLQPHTSDGFNGGRAADPYLFSKYITRVVHYVHMRWMTTGLINCLPFSKFWIHVWHTPHTNSLGWKPKFGVHASSYVYTLCFRASHVFMSHDDVSVHFWWRLWSHMLLVVKISCKFNCLSLCSNKLPTCCLSCNEPAA